MSIVSPTLAKKLDESPYVINNWRRGWTFPSVWTFLSMLILSAGYGITLAAGVVPFWMILPHFIVAMVMSLLAIIGTLVRFLKKKGDSHAED